VDLQNEEVLQLENALAQADQPVDRLQILNGLGWKLIGTQSQRARSLAEEARQVAQELGDELGLANSLLTIGSVDLEYGTTDEALETLSQAEAIFNQHQDGRGLSRTLDAIGWCYYIRGDYEKSRESTGEPLEIADTLNSLSAVYGDLGMYAEAIEALIRAEEIARECHSLRDQTRFITNQGTLYMEVGDNKKALELLERVLVLADEIGYDKMKVFALGSIGMVYRELGDYDQALEYSRLSLTFRPEMTPKYQRSDVLVNAADVYCRMRRFDEAEPLLREALEICIEIVNTTTEARGRVIWGRWLLAHNHPEEALQEMNLGLELSEKTDFQQGIYLAHLELADAYASLGNYQKAFAHHQEYHRVQQAVFNRETVARRRLLETQMFVEQVRQERQTAEALRITGSVLSATLEMEQVKDAIIQQVGAIVPSDLALLIWLENDNARVVRALGTPALTEAEQTTWQDYEIKIEEYPQLVRMMETGQPMVIPDTAMSPVWRSCDMVTQAAAWIGVPIMAYDRQWGIMCLSSRKANTYQARQAHFLSIFAGQSALALENARLFDEVKRLAITDSLTGLYTRRQLFYLGERELERFRRYGTVFSAIMLDLDDFKKINDTYGHLVGDQVLMTTAERCRQNVRSVDIIGRYGGEEFVLILPEINTEGARRSAERLRDVISASPVETESGPVMISASLGVAEIGPHHQRLEDLIHAADLAAYRAKSSGRNRVEG
jgi:diguanylate cyclase (GGDEF)-like protein